MAAKSYIGYTVRISKKGEVTLRTPGGRATAWGAVCDDPDKKAQDWLECFTGAVLDDQRIKEEGRS